MAVFLWRMSVRVVVIRVSELLMAIATGCVFLFAGALVVFLFRCFLLLLRETFRGFEGWLGVSDDSEADTDAKR